MTKILVSDLHIIGLDLFLDPESFLDSMRDLSENELKMTFGGKKDSSKSKSKKSKTTINSNTTLYSHGIGGGANCVPSGGTGGGGN